MKNIRILIVEDEPIIADDIAYTLEEIGYYISGIAHDADDAMAHIALNKPDLVLLDINLEGDVDGIHIAQKLHDIYHIPFIFLTSFSDRTTVDRAKVTEPSGYLVKPVDEGDLRANVEVALYNHAVRDDSSKPPNFFFRDAIFIKDHYRLVKVKIEDILFAEASNNYCFIHTRSKKYILSVTLKAVAEKLDAWQFLRIHRTYMVNPRHITEIADRFVHIAAHQLPVSRKYYDDFMKMVKTF